MVEEYLELFGFLASFIVLISLLMSSILKLRWINLIGAVMFSVYGFLIEAYPVGFLNLAIVFINIYYLVKIYGSKEYFKILPIIPTSDYLQYFLSFYKKDIENFFYNIDLKIDESTVGFYILRNMVPAGIFIAKEDESNKLRIQLDYVIPQYRDFKIGQYIYQKQQEFFISKGFKVLSTISYNKDHQKYLLKMGFQPVQQDSNEYELIMKS